jgi:uncharacterized membrane protein YcaP (DUF421 family)
MSDYAGIAGKAALVYVFLVVVVRILGKRTLGKLTAFDLILTIIMGRVAAAPILGDTPVPEALVAVVVLAGLHFLNSYVGYRSPAFERLTGGTPTLLVRDGRIDRRAMARERVSEEELWQLLREHQVEELDGVERAVARTRRPIVGRPHRADAAPGEARPPAAGQFQVGRLHVQRGTRRH